MNKNQKAVILARGLGTRMKADQKDAALSPSQDKIAGLGLKTFVPIVGEKTLLDFIFENLTKAGFRRFCLVIGAEHQAIRDFCATKPYDISFVIQEKPLGTADAVLAAEGFVEDELFLVVNSDNLYPISDLRNLSELDQPGLIAFERTSLIQKSNIHAERINGFAVIETDDTDHLCKITEKPQKVEENSFVSMNAWLFSPTIFAACRSINLSPRKEFELTEAVMFAIENLGEKFKAVRSTEGVLDLSSRADVKGAAEKLRSSG